MDKKEMKSIIEGILFVWGEPLALKDIAKIFEIKEQLTSSILKEMILEFEENRRGLRIVKADDHYQIGTRPEHSPWIKQLAESKGKKTLSTASLETLSIIAYSQPIIKSEIEIIRGVKCDRSLLTLMDKGLIEETGRLEKTGRPIVYGTTKEFLIAFGLESLLDLPNLEEFEKRIKEENVKNVEIGRAHV